MATSSSGDERPKAAPPKTAPQGVTDDAFLGGRVRIWQPRQGFRAGLDSVMLAAAVPARLRERVCDLGAGVGTAALCLAARIGELHVTAVEIDAALADLARKNAARNGLATFDAIVADVAKRPRAVPRQVFHHVLTNPPYHDVGRGTRAPQGGKARATSAHERELFDWLRFARALVRPKGTVTAILPPEQLPVALRAFAPDGAGVEIVPLWPKAGEPAKRIIIRIRTNARTPLRILPGVVLHEAGGSPSVAADAVLRRGEALTT